MTKKIVFDMDGTIADFYNCQNWKQYLQEQNPYPYQAAHPLYNMFELNILLQQLKDLGYEIAVVTWLAKNSTKEYDQKVRTAKRNWLKLFNFPYDELHIVKYGTPKHTVIKADLKILIDDNDDVLNAWRGGYTIDAKYDIMNELKNLLV